MIPASDLIAYITITTVLALAAGFTIGFATRPTANPVKPTPCPRCDDAAIRAEAVRFNAVIASLDLNTPDQEQP